MARVVAEASAGAHEANHVASLVGAFMQRQPLVGHYVQSHRRELGVEGVVLTLLHASLLARAVEIASGRALAPLGAAELDLAASAPLTDPARFAAAEPELAGYLESNLAVDDATLGGARREVALGLLRSLAAAFLDEGERPAVRPSRRR